MSAFVLILVLVNPNGPARGTTSLAVEAGGEANCARMQKEAQAKSSVVASFCLERFKANGVTVP